MEIRKGDTVNPWTPPPGKGAKNKAVKAYPAQEKVLVEG